MGKGFPVCSTVVGNGFGACSNVVGKGFPVWSTLVHGKGFRVSSEKRFLHLQYSAVVENGVQVFKYHLRFPAIMVSRLVCH